MPNAEFMSNAEFSPFDIRHSSFVIRHSSFVMGFGIRHSASVIDYDDYDVIAYTTMLTANLVLSSRWKRLLRQS